MEEPPQKRFRYTTYNQQLKNISVDVGKQRGLGWQKEEFNEDTEQTSTPLTSEIERLSLLDLTIPYQDVQRILIPLTNSLPITLHNLPEIQKVFHNFYSNLADGHEHTHSGLDSVLFLHQALYETCIGEAVVYVPETVKDLLRVGSLRALDPKLVERTYSTLSLILRTIASSLLKSNAAAQAALEETWENLYPYLAPKANRSYVRRCVADAWTGVIRKARSEGLNRLMDLLLSGDFQGMEAVWAHSMKGASGQLHSRGVAIYTALFDHLVNSPSAQQTNTLSLVSTALVHHTSASVNQPIVEVVLDRLSKATSLSSTTAILHTLSAFLFTRKGKRFPSPLLKPLMQRFVELIPKLTNEAVVKEDLVEEEKETRGAFRKWLVSGVVGALQAGQLAQWLSPGVVLIDKLWQSLDDHECFAFVNALVALKWTGVEQFILSHVAKASLSSLNTDPLSTLVLLNNLASSGYLSGGLSNVQGGRWRQSLVSALVGLLQSLGQSQLESEERRVLGQILSLVPALPGDADKFTPEVISLLKSTLEKLDKETEDDLKNEWKSQGAWNDTHILGLLLRAADELITASKADVSNDIKGLLVDEGWAKKVIEKWSWSREIMRSVVPHIERWATEIGLPHDQTLEHFMPNIMSADSQLRLSSLQVLNAIAPTQPLHSNPEECTTSLHHIYNHCVQIESSEMTLRNVRERTTEISRLTRALAALPSKELLPANVLAAVVAYITSQLKVNFRPIYPEAIATLSSIAEQHKEIVWETLWSELQKTNSSSAAIAVDLDIEYPEWALVKGETEQKIEKDEDEAEFRCPNLEKSRVIFGKVWERKTQENKLDEHEVISQISHDKLDVLNYEAQLLSTLGAMPLVAEKHTRLITPVFFSVARQGTSEDDEPSSATHLSTKQLQARTANYLELFSKFVNPKAAFRAEELHQLYLSLLSKGEPKLQGLAVKCLMTYKSPSLTPYSDSLESLLEDNKFRDELQRMRLGVDSQDYALAARNSEAAQKTRVIVIEPTHRSEALPVIIRLLYGIMTSRRGRSSSAQGQAARKQAVLSALNGCSSEELGTLVDLMLEPFGETMDDAGKVTGRQQMGFLSLLTDVIRYLGPQLGVHWDRLVNNLVNLIGYAQERLTASDIVTEDAHEGDETEGVETEKGMAPLRNIRSIGLKRLVQFLRSPVEFDVKPYLPTIFQYIISPRLDKLEVENTQAPSGTLDLIATLAAKSETAMSLTGLDQRTLPKAFACMTAVKVKPAVVLKVFDIIDSLLVEDDEAALTKEVLLPHIRVLIDNVIGLVASLKASQNDDITRRLLTILSHLSAIVEDGQQAQQLATLLAPMLRNRQTHEKAKTNILATLERLYAICPDFTDTSSKFFYQSYDVISSLFQTLFFSSSRRALVKTFETFAAVDPSLAKSVKLVADLNSYSAKRVEEPDFDRRLSAFEAINDGPEEELPQDVRAWTPILRSCLFFLHEPEELSIRTSASAVLQRFIAVVGSSSDGAYVNALQNIILPGLKRALKSKIELVRGEALLVIAQGVKLCDGVPELKQMKPLLAEGDDEASFFTNISHIQVHRRARALVRLRSIIAEPTTSIQENTYTSIFLPLLEHIIAGATDITDHHLINEAIQTVGGLAQELRWNKWYSLIQRYMKLGLGSGKTAQQKYYVRSVAAVIDGFHFDLGTGDAMDIDEKEGDDEEGDDDEDEVVKKDDGASPEKIMGIILNKLLPSLTKFVADKDDAESTIRVPLALGVVKIAHTLPGPSAETEVLRAITTVAQILRSRDQDTRDITRETICKIAIYLGPGWLVKLIKELEVALPRGPQKHILAVTTHAILVQATTQASDRFANLDDAVQLAVQIAAEVVWGESGKDVDSEGFKTKMREVRGATSRGFDTFQLLSQLVSPSKIGAVLVPIQDVMHASQAVKAMQQLDEALRRISLGLNANSLLSPQDILSLCHSLISGNSSHLKAKRKAARPADTPEAFKVVMKRDVKAEEDFYPANAHKLVMFGLDLFVTAFRRGKFAFDDVDILSRLGPMVNAIGNTLYSSTSNVLLLSLKATAAIARCPIPQVEGALHVYINNIFKIIKHAGGTAETEVAQTALKTLSVILRDCKTSEVSETQLKYLIEVISPDLEESDRQSAIFTVLRAIITRKFVVPEIYDLMERVSSIMVTSQSTHVQELCRGSVMAFLLDYPQGKGRLKSQMTFFAQNLQYTYDAGRLSVMEVLSAVFEKFSDDLIEEYAGMFFVALVVTRANDDSEKCRVAAGELLKVLWRRLDEDARGKMAEVVKSWIAQHDENETLAGAAMGVLGLLVETGGEGLGDVASVVNPVLKESAATLQEAEEQDEAVELDYTLPHHTLATTAKLVLANPSASSSLPWTDIVPHLLFPHDYVRYDTAKLISNLFANDADPAVVCEMLGNELCLDIARKGCLVLKGNRNENGEWMVGSGKLADEVVKCLYNISKYWAATEQPLAAKDVEEGADEEEDRDEEEHVKKPLAWLMSRMSFVARHLIVNRPAPHSFQAQEQWSAPILSILRFFAGVTECLSKAQAIGFLVHVLSPVYRILDEGGDLGQVEDKQVDDLRELATQVREFVTTKSGISAFSKAWEKLRQTVTAKRQERREGRVKLAFTNPELHAEKREKKVERQKEGKKRKIRAFAEGRKVPGVKKRKQ
ncbi:hypothetical protein L202_02973 [Cryptococcus amylolentus CBS 6039]|uniref:Uncharacterized protein n=1 Tax=Cryptococcus amylolentus CBS 6039 TaxID=1295533 RepID=A0A1E3HWY4_9TREE|nr:hypothetical protein L202_02973 [Cryptococcus amylolentus CBS 6039]ODN80830.1 hypothetical protein L202_02973 [Cryptococcus amylolentus CBS 6039]